MTDRIRQAADAGLRKWKERMRNDPVYAAEMATLGWRLRGRRSARLRPSRSPVAMPSER